MSAVNANTVMETRDVNQMLLNTLKTSYKEMLQDVIRVICNHYNLDHDDVKEYVDSKIDGVNLVKKEKATKPKAPKLPCPVPFCGDVKENQCMGVKFNRGLFTQCPKKPGTGTHYCATCKKSADTSEDGKPIYGDIRDRAKMGFDFEDKKGRTPKTWATVLKTMKLDLDECKDIVERQLGIEIPEEHLVVQESGKGRPKKAKKSKKSSNVDDAMAQTDTEDADLEEAIDKAIDKAIDNADLEDAINEDFEYVINEDFEVPEEPVKSKKVKQPKKKTSESSGDEDFEVPEPVKPKKVKQHKKKTSESSDYEESVKQKKTLKKSDMKKVKYNRKSYYVNEKGKVYDMSSDAPVRVGTYDEEKDQIIGNKAYKSVFVYDDDDEDDEFDFSDAE